jgi:voltage-gated potassium channel
VFIYFIVSVLIATIGFAILEKRSLLNSFYWAIITLTTIGYGDVTPVTVAGKIFSLVIALLGIGTIAIFAGIIATYLIGLQAILEERRVKRMKDILLICGYNEKIKNFLKEIDIKTKDIVCLAPLAERPVDLPENIVYISGEPYLDENLKRANIANCKEAIISLEKDQDAILTVLTIENFNKEIITICNVVRETNLQHLTKLGVDKVFCDELVGGQIFAALYLGEDYYAKGRDA